MKNLLNKSKFPFIVSLFVTLISFNLQAQKIDDAFFNQTDALLKTHVKNGLVDYAGIAKDQRLAQLISSIETADLSSANTNTKIAFYINAYNLHVVNQVVDNYPLISVINHKGFFESNKITVAGEKLTLNNLENENLLGNHFDARYHFVLVCGALGCPPITDFAYTPQDLENQLEEQSRKALNDASFIKVSDNEVALSEIFKWYAKDFGGSNKEVLKFINIYRSEKIAQDAKVKYYDYDWSLNEKSGTSSIELNGENGSNAARYIVSSTIPKGSFEVKIFNNLYSQTVGKDSDSGNRSSFFTTSFSGLYGLNNRINVGVAGRFRKVRNNPTPSTAFSVFGQDNASNSRSGLTALGPQIRIAPKPEWKNFSIQSSIVFPIGQDLAGSDSRPYIDWTGITWNTQFFNDFDIGSKFSLFTEIDFLYEDIGSLSQGHANRVSTPVTLIFSYVPSSSLVFYTLAGYSPYWQVTFDYFAQFGVGSKYQITPNHEIEVLYTKFSNRFLNESNGEAQTINLGFRVNL